MGNKALITGITGQDGSYLAELLLSKGYEVHGIIRRSSYENLQGKSNITGIADKIKLHVASIDDQLALYKLFSHNHFDECYHLGAYSFVSYDFDEESSMLNQNFYATHYLLRCIKELNPECRFYFAGTSEMFGEAPTAPQNELTPFNPRSIYGISKLASYHILRNYRQNYGLFLCSGILYNHESERRGFEYVTRKITSTVARIHLGLADRVELGNIDAERDWGYSPDYVEAMWLMMNCAVPEDYVVATGNLHSVRNILEIAFGYINENFEKYLAVNQQYFRPSSKTPLVGDASKVREKLGWQPKKPFEEMIRDMVSNDIALIKRDKEVR